MSSRRWFRVRNEQVFSDLGAQSAGGHADMTAGGSLGPYTGPPADEPSDNHQADNHQADHELMAAIARGDRNAFALLVSRHLGRALVIARGFDGLEAEAEDVVQEAFTKVWTNAAQWQPPTDGSVEDRQRTGKASFATWFHRVLVNRCIDRQRQVKRGGRGRDAALDSIAEPADERPNAADRLASDDRDRQVRQAVADLPERQRIALTLCAFEGHSNAEAGDIMGLGVKAIEALLVRARRQLRDALDPSLLDLAG